MFSETMNNTPSMILYYKCRVHYKMVKSLTALVKKGGSHSQ